MASNRTGRPPEMTDSELLSFVRGHDDPGVTSREVAEEFGISRRGAHKRLSDLEEEGRLYGKRIGSSATVWFPTG